MIEHKIIEGNLAAIKDTSDFGGPNMWEFYVKTANGFWEKVQWMDVYRIQTFFKEKLPVYTAKQKPAKYKLIK
jgi:hypothetical protein